MIINALVVGSLATNSYVVGSEETRHAMIIDPGADASSILSTVRALGLSVVFIVATHNHADHIGAVRCERCNGGRIRDTRS